MLIRSFATASQMKQYHHKFLFAVLYHSQSVKQRSKGLDAVLLSFKGGQQGCAESFLEQWHSPLPCLSLSAFFSASSIHEDKRPMVEPRGTLLHADRQYTSRHQPRRMKTHLSSALILQAWFWGVIRSCKASISLGDQVSLRDQGTYKWLSILPSGGA